MPLRVGGVHPIVYHQFAEPHVALLRASYWPADRHIEAIALKVNAHRQDVMLRFHGMPFHAMKALFQAGHAEGDALPVIAKVSERRRRVPRYWLPASLHQSTDRHPL